MLGYFPQQFRQPQQRCSPARFMPVNQLQPQPQQQFQQFQQYQQFQQLQIQKIQQIQQNQKHSFQYQNQPQYNNQFMQTQQFYQQSLPFLNRTNYPQRFHNKATQPTQQRVINYQPPHQYVTQNQSPQRLPPVSRINQPIYATTIINQSQQQTQFLPGYIQVQSPGNYQFSPQRGSTQSMEPPVRYTLEPIRYSPAKQQKQFPQGAHQPVIMSPVRLPQQIPIQQYATPQNILKFQNINNMNINTNVYSRFTNASLPPRSPNTASFLNQPQQNIYIAQNFPPQQQYYGRSAQRPNLSPEQYRQQTQENIQNQLNQQSQRKAKVDLEKRFSDALERTKKIVAKFNNDEKKSRIQNAVDIVKESAMVPDDQEMEEVPEEDPVEVSEEKEIKKQSSDEEDDEDVYLEQLALEFGDGYIYRGYGVAPQTRQGFGVLQDVNEEEVYSGFWDKNFYHGEGRLTNINQTQIEGKLDWKDMTTINNGWCKYEGEFKRGKMHGRGNLTLTNDELFTGNFIDGMIEGEGQFVDVDKNIIQGIWLEGVFQGPTK